MMYQMKDILGSSIAQLSDAVVASRFDLLMMVVGLTVYMVLCASRNQKKEAKDLDAKVCVTPSFAQVNMVDPSEHLSQVLESMESCKDDMHTGGVDDLDMFLDKHPAHQFTLHDVETILRFCSRCLVGYSWASVSAAALADRLFELMKPSDEGDVLSAFLGFYLDNKHFAKACDIFELNYATFFDIELDEHMQYRLLMAASQCGRQSLADHLLQTSQVDVAKNVAIIQRWWKRSSAQMGESRVAQMGDVFNRLSNIFNERYPFEDEEHEHSDGESTCFLGDDSDRDEESDDSDWEQM